MANKEIKSLKITDKNGQSYTQNIKKNGAGVDTSDFALKSELDEFDAEAYKEELGYSWQRVLTEPFYSLKCETGFRIIIKGIASLFSSYQMLFVITSIFLIYCFFNATRNYSVFYCISVMVFMTDSFAARAASLVQHGTPKQCSTISLILQREHEQIFL